MPIPKHVEARLAASYPEHAAALERALESFRNRLLADLARAETLEARARVRDQIRDVARLIRWGILPIAAYLSRGTDCPELSTRVQHVLSELDGFAHPAAGLPQNLGTPACAACPVLNEIPRKLELIAAGIGRMTIQKGARQ